MLKKHLLSIFTSRWLILAESLLVLLQTILAFTLAPLVLLFSPFEWFPLIVILLGVYGLLSLWRYFLSIKYHRSPPLWATIKGGIIAAAPMGDVNASIPTPQPVHYRMMFGALAEGTHISSITFMSQVAIDVGVPAQLGLKKRVSAVKNTRNIRKSDMKLNDYLPVMEVDPETYIVKADGVHLTCEPAEVLPLAQRYFLF